MTAKFLINQWYAAGFPSDFGTQPVLRTLLEQEIVFFRTESERLVALNDRCPHRFAPLHLGRVIGECLRCPYHGLEFGINGVCQRNPSCDGPIPPALKSYSYPLVEKDGVIWIWFGEQPADESRVLRWSEFSDGSHDMVRGYMRIQAPHQLLVDNLMDLSHAEFLHPNLGGEGFNKRTQYSVHQDGNVVSANHWRPNVPVSKFFSVAYGDQKPDHVDHRAISRWYPPSNVHVEVGATGLGLPNSEGPTTLTSHLITPESETATHYFWTMARDFRLNDADFGQWLQSMVQSAFQNEDEPMIEAQFRKLGGQSFESLKPVLLPTDAATVKVRRILSSLLSKQNA